MRELEGFCLFPVMMMGCLMRFLDLMIKFKDELLGLAILFR